MKADHPAYLAQLLRDLAAVGAPEPLRAQLLKLSDRIESLPVPAPKPSR